MRSALSLMTLLAVVGFTACSNAIYYYQSDRVSLTLETRPDPTQPVQGNLGLKQRIAIITPGIESLPFGGENRPVSNSPSFAQGEPSAESAPSVRKETTLGEALSMIGSFQFEIERGTGVEVGPVIIKAALICGDAATQLNESQAQSATKAFTVQSIPTYDSLAMAAIEKAQAAGLKVLGVVAIIDRLEGGAEAFGEE